MFTVNVSMGKRKNPQSVKLIMERIIDTRSSFFSPLLAPYFMDKKAMASGQIKNTMGIQMVFRAPKS